MYDLYQCIYSTKLYIFYCSESDITYENFNNLPYKSKLYFSCIIRAGKQSKKSHKWGKAKKIS